jgi:hydroxyacylglutathione hydrolase
MSEPYGVCTGDTLFIGDVGRPDLLSSIGFTADDLAHQLYDSLHTKLMMLPDATKVYPAHGAGSSCGKNLSSETVSTIGEQRRTNYALAPMTVEQFVEAVTQGQSVAPLYFLFAATKNRQAHDLFVDEKEVTKMSLEEVIAAQANGAVVIDSRDDMTFAAGHLRGSVNVGLSGRFAEYVGEVMDPGTAIVLIGEPGTDVEAKMRLARIGFDNVLGALSDPLRVFFENPTVVEQQSRLSVEAFNERISSMSNVVLVDIRNPGEVELGSIPHARHISLPSLLKRIDELDKTSPLVVFCRGGYRSSIASSLLKSHGFTDVSDLIGGYTAWTAAQA